MTKLLLLILLPFLSVTNAQEYTIKGKVEENITHKPLSYANIRVDNSTLGTAANKNGKYELKLNAGKYILIASYIGFKSDTISITVIENLNDVNFFLPQTNINLPEIVIKAGENPALAIIKKAINEKNKREKKIIDYEFEVYTKGVLKTQHDVNTQPRSNGLSLGIGINDTLPLKITGILENESKGYFKKPNDYKEIILARKQTVNLPPQLNVFTGGRIVQNFYENNINFIGINLPGPLADNALDYYYYFLRRTTAIDNKIVYDISITPKDIHDPGFKGNIFIVDSTFDLIKIDLGINRAANPGNIFDSLRIIQQFSLFDSIYMPVDYRLFVKVNYLGIAKFGFEMNSILHNYKINTKIDNDIFDKAIITVLPGADKKDEKYWSSIQAIPNTLEEKKAYDRIDSLKNIPRSFWDDFSILSQRLNFSDDFSVSAPLRMYHFNRVEGHTIDFGFYLNQALDKRLNSSLNFSYGFSDKKFKTDLYSKYSFGDYRTYDLSINIFNKIQPLSSSSFEDKFKLTSSLITLFSKYEEQDYFYKKGFNLKLSGEVFPILKLNAGFSNSTYNNAFTNTDISILNSHKVYSQNRPIYESKINTLSAGFTLDFRNYIEDGFFRKRTSLGNSFIIFQGEVTKSDKSLLKSDLDFTTYELQSWGKIYSFKSTDLSFNIYGMYNKGKLPYQLLHSVQGNISVIRQNFSFRTLELNEVLGDRVITVNLEYNWKDEIFRFLKIPVLKDSELQLKTFFNTALSDVGEQSRSILTFPVNSFKKPFYEIGFGIGHILIPIQIEFAWKLNHKGKNNFRLGIATFLL